MKRVLFGLLLSILVAFSGCEGTLFTPDFAPVQAFALQMTATVNGKEFRATLTCRSYEEIALSFTAPEQLAGFSARTEGDGYVIDALGVPDAFRADTLPAGSPFRLLFDTVKTAVFTNHGAFVRDKAHEAFTAALTVNGVPVAVTFDADGFLTGVTADAFCAVFSR